MPKQYLDIDVYSAAKERIKILFDEFEKICVSFSGGKDSGVLLHLVMDRAIKLNRKVSVLFIDWEAQYKLTIDYVRDMLDFYSEHIDPYWVSLPMTTPNACSMFEPEWISWEKGKEERWVRQAPKDSITEYDFFSFYNYAMTFEEFVPEFGQWISGGVLTANLVGIRTDESLNRFRSLMGHKNMFEDYKWTTYNGGTTYSAYPIYDWETQDIWRYYGLSEKLYNKLYDLMYKAGVSIHQQRICEPYGPQQRQGLWLFQLIEPETWGKVVARVSGANTGNVYAKETGNILGNIKVTKPEGHTWKSFAMLLLDSMPPNTSEHYRNKIAVWLKWYRERGFPKDVYDEIEGDLGSNSNDLPSWRRVCKTLLRNDYWCYGLCFAPTKTKVYGKYCKLMKIRRRKWGILTKGI